VGTLTQRHGHLIGTEPQGVESRVAPAIAVVGGENDGPGPGVAVTGAPNTATNGVLRRST
jgi:hypothetical protein